MKRITTLETRNLCESAKKGGYGIWEMAMCYPEMFAAIAPVAGGGLVWRTGKLVKMPVLAYHGEKDTVVPASQSEIMVNFTNNNGGMAELDILKDKGHNDGIDYAYRETDLIQKLISYRKYDFSHIPEICEDMF